MGWEYGKNNRNEDFSEGQSQSIVRAENQERKNREEATDRAKLKGQIISCTEVQNNGREISNVMSTYGSDKEEFDGLNLEERNRRRYGPAQVDCMDTDGIERNFNDSALSKADCTEPNNTTLATLARQSS